MVGFVLDRPREETVSFDDELFALEGLEPGLRIVSSLPEVTAEIRCGIVTTSSDLELCAETFRELLRRGCNVISTCEELSWPWLRHPVLAQELQELAVRHRASIVGTGVNPGFLMDALPVAVTTACHEVRSIRVERIQDASTRTYHAGLHVVELQLAGQRVATAEFILSR